MGNFSIKYSSLYFLLYKIIIVFIFFDGILNNSIFTQLKGIKYIIVFLLLALTIIRKGKISLNYGIILFFLYHIFIGIVSFSGFLGDSTGFSVYKQFFFFLFLIYIFQNFEKNTGYSYNELLKYFIKIGVIYVYVNAFLYFVEIPIWTKFRPWWGRISQGYPPVDGVVLTFCLSVIIIHNNLGITFKKRLFYTISILVGISSIVSATAFVLTFILLLFTSPVLFYKGNSLLRRNLLSSFSFILFIILILSIIFRIKEPLLYESTTEMMNNKIAQILNKESDIEVNTLEIRDNRYEHLQDVYLKFPENRLFGVGYNKVNYNVEELDNNSIFLEDQYSFNLITGGIISNVLFIILLLELFIRAFFFKKNSPNIKFLTGVSVIILALAAFTSVVLDAFCIIATFSLVYSCSYYRHLSDAPSSENRLDKIGTNDDIY